MDLVYTHLLSNLKMLDFAPYSPLPLIPKADPEYPSGNPMPPNFWGNLSSKSPKLGSQCGLGASPSRATGVDLGGEKDLLKDITPHSHIFKEVCLKIALQVNS
jgi:hypothetical protein